MILTLAALTIAVANVAGRPVEINITPVGFSGTAFIGEPQMWIGSQAVLSARHGQGAGLLILLHEVGHTTGITDEAQADCWALSHLRPFARRYWHLGRRAVQWRFRDAVAFMRTALPSTYQCGSVR